MQIVIDIPEEEYMLIKQKMELNVGGVTSEAEQIIVNGTPLPKGYVISGDLDALREEISSWGVNDYEPSDFIDAIDQRDIIIEADKENKKDEHMTAE